MESAMSQSTLAAYRRLKLTPHTVAAAPKCTPFFEQIGGVPLVLEALRCSPAPEARAFLFRYDDPKFPARYRDILPLEAFCVAANVCPSRLTEIAVAAIAKSHVLRGAVIAALAHPDIMETNVIMAQDAQGTEDRMAHFKMVGAMPSAKGAQTVVNVNATASAAADAKSLASAAPPAEDTIKRMVEARQRAAALGAGQQQALPPAPEQHLPFTPKQRELVTVDAGDGEDDVSSD
jgi:hypothetical protein